MNKLAFWIEFDARIHVPCSTAYEGSMARL